MTCLTIVIERISSRLNEMLANPDLEPGEARQLFSRVITSTLAGYRVDVGQLSIQEIGFIDLLAGGSPPSIAAFLSIMRRVATA
jgi:hypothetical protein